MSSDIQNAREHFRVKGNLLLLRSRRLFLVLRLSGSLNYIVFALITFWTRFLHQMTFLIKNQNIILKINAGVCGIF